LQSGAKAGLQVARRLRGESNITPAEYLALRGNIGFLLDSVSNQQLVEGLRIHLEERAAQARAASLSNFDRALSDSNSTMAIKEWWQLRWWRAAWDVDETTEKARRLMDKTIKAEIGSVSAKFDKCMSLEDLRSTLEDVQAIAKQRSAFRNPPADLPPWPKDVPQASLSDEVFGALEQANRSVQSVLDLLTKESSTASLAEWHQRIQAANEAHQSLRAMAEMLVPTDDEGLLQRLRRVLDNLMQMEHQTDAAQAALEAGDLMTSLARTTSAEQALGRAERPSAILMAPGLDALVKGLRDKFDNQKSAENIKLRADVEQAWKAHKDFKTLEDRVLNEAQAALLRRAGDAVVSEAVKAARERPEESSSLPLPSSRLDEGKRRVKRHLSSYFEQDELEIDFGRLVKGIIETTE
jgi:hypothetical protein